MSPQDADRSPRQHVVVAARGVTVNRAKHVHPVVLDRIMASLQEITGTGVDVVHLWAYPVAGGAPTFIGQAVYGTPRPDVARCSARATRRQGLT
jgi:hypothetical protein